MSLPPDTETWRGAPCHVLLFVHGHSVAIQAQNIHPTVWTPHLCLCCVPVHDSAVPPPLPAPRLPAGGTQKGTLMQPSAVPPTHNSSALSSVVLRLWNHAPPHPTPHQIWNYPNVSNPSMHQMILWYLHQRTLMAEHPPCCVEGLWV